MKHIECASYEALGRAAADIMAAQLLQKPTTVFGLATGSTPISTYEALIADYRAGKLDFSQAFSVNLDEYCGIPVAHSQSYHTFMQENFFYGVNLKAENRHLPDPSADPKQACADYDALIESLGGVDLQILGIGLNGHIGFNEPSDEIPVGTHVVDLSESTRNANARFFDSIDEVPRQAITMGMGPIMRARKILLLAEGEAKRDIIRKAMYGPVTPQVPASFLQLHPDVVVITHF